MQPVIRICTAILLAIVVLPAFGSTAKEYLVFSGNSNPALTEKITKALDMPMGKAKIKRFNDGEINIQLFENVRNKSVFIIQSTCKSKTATVNDNIMELYLLARTLKRSSAKEITAIIPYYGYARQDRKTAPRVPISASDVAMLLESSGIDRVVAVDLHSGQIQGFFHKIPVDNLYASTLMVPYFAKLKLKNPVIVSPDAGGVERAKKFKEALAKRGVKSELAIIVKQRAKAGVVARADLIGNVTGKDAIIIDDMCDTGGTLVKAAQELKKFGANTVYAGISHPVFSKDAIQKIENSSFDKVVVTDSIPLRKENLNKITTISIAPLLAEAIERIHNGVSLSKVFSS